MDLLDKITAVSKHVRTGDKVLYRGTGWKSSGIVRVSDRPGSPARYSHIEVVIVLSGVPYLFGANAGDGCRLRPFIERIATYDGAATLRQVVDLTNQNHESAAWDFISEFHAAPYEEHVIDLVAAAVPLIQDGKEDLTSLFCSELVYEFDQAIGWQPKEQPSDSVLPADYQDDRPMRMNHAYMLPEIILKTA